MAAETRLADGLERAPGLRLVAEDLLCGDRVAADSGPLLQALEQLRLRGTAMGLPVEWDREDAAASAPDGRARVIVGAPGSERMSAWLGQLGVDLREDKAHILGRVLPLARMRLIATFEDPQRPGLPLTLVCAQSSLSQAGLLGVLDPDARPRLRLWDGPDALLRVDLNAAGRALPSTFLDLAPRSYSHPKDYVWGSGESRTDRLQRGLDVDELEALRTQWNQSRARLEAWTGALTKPAMPLVVDGWMGERLAQGAGYGRWTLAPGGGGPLRVSLDPDRELAAGDCAAKQGEVLSVLTLGPPALHWLPRAAGLEAANSYGGVELEAWLGEGRGWPFSMQALLDGNELGASPHELDPARALLLRIAKEQNPEALLQAWREGAGVDWLSLEAAFRERLARASEGRAAAQRSLREGAGPVGVLCEAPLGVRAPSIGSRAALDQLEVLASAGVGRVALLLRMPPPHRSPGPGPGDAVRWTSAEGDAAVVSWLLAARRAGLESALVLERWLTPSSVPAGDAVMGTTRDLEAFFRLQAGAAAHAASLARMGKAELLCLGLGQAATLRTLESEEESGPGELREARAKGWSEVFAAARAVFSGPVTVSRSGPRHAGFGLGQELDLCAVELRPDLTQREMRVPPSAELLKRGAGLQLTRCLELAKEEGRPLVILPLGVGSTTTSARGLLAGPGAVDPGETLRIQQAWASALTELVDTDLGPAVVYLSRWSTHCQGPAGTGPPAVPRGLGVFLTGTR